MLRIRQNPAGRPIKRMLIITLWNCFCPIELERAANPRCLLEQSVTIHKVQHYVCRHSSTSLVPQLSRSITHSSCSQSHSLALIELRYAIEPPDGQ
jgi:hypothetical protein